MARLAVMVLGLCGAFGLSCEIQPRLTRDVGFQKFRSHPRTCEALTARFNTLVKKDPLKHHILEVAALQIYCLLVPFERTRWINGQASFDELFGFPLLCLKSSSCFKHLWMNEIEFDETPMPDILNFFAKKCGTRRLTFSRVTNLNLRVLSSAPIYKIRDVAINRAGLVEFPPLFNFVAARQISLLGNKIQHLVLPYLDARMKLHRMPRVRRIVLDGNPMFISFTNMHGIFSPKTVIALSGGAISGGVQVRLAKLEDLGFSKCTAL